MMETVPNGFPVLDEQQSKALASGLDEIADALARIDDEKELINEIIGNLTAETKIGKSDLRKLATFMHDDSIKSKIDELESFRSMLEYIDPTLSKIKSDRQKRKVEIKLGG